MRASDHPPRSRPPVHPVVVAFLAALAVLVLGAPATVATQQGSSKPLRWHVPVLMYHNVEPPSAIRRANPLPGLYVDPAYLDRQMKALHDAGWHSISTAELAAAMRTGSALPNRSIVISFDDGRPNNYRLAAPIVEKYGFRATFFVVPGRIGTPGSMTAAEITDLAARGHEIANHTMDHVDLSTLTYDAARLEIRRAGDAIEAMTGTRPVALAYPYGKTSEVAQRAAADEGIQLAFVTDLGSPEVWAAHLDLHRVRVAGMTRFADGAVGGGETALGLLRSIAFDSHRPGFAGVALTPSPVPRQATATDVPSAPLPSTHPGPTLPGGAGSPPPAALPIVVLGTVVAGAAAVLAPTLMRRRRRDPS
jgi:peptidoglycan/xylan/chitin deacetylase (PgdA/CDA1 family)